MIFIALILSLIAAFALIAARFASFALLASRALHCSAKLSFALLALASFALGAASCADMHEPEAVSENPESPVGDTFLTISLRYDGDNDAKDSRAGEGDGGEPTDTYPVDDIYAYGDDYENLIHSITIFMADMDGKTQPDDPYVLPTGIDLEAFSVHAYPTPHNFKTSGALTYSQLIPENLSAGNKVIFVGVNLSQRIINHILNNGLSSPYTFQGQSMALVNEITSKSNGFVMFCTKPEYVNITKKENISLNFDVRRIMAKVLVTAKSDDGVHAKVRTNFGETPSFQVNVRDIQFIVNTINHTTYIYQNFSKEGDKYICKDGNWKTFGDGSSFSYHPIYSWQNYNSLFMDVLLHNDDRMPSQSTVANKDNWYTEGLYVPENCFNPNIIQTGSDEEKALEAEQNVSHVIVRAFITPLKMKVNYGLINYIRSYPRADIPSDHIADRIEALFGGGTHNPTELATYTCTGFAGDNTVSSYTAHQESSCIFRYALEYESYPVLSNEAFLMKGNDFYTYSAAKIEYQNNSYEKGTNNTSEFAGFVLYPKGYAHYKVYLNDNLGEGDNHKPSSGTQPASSTEWSESQIYRNTYYILTIDQFAGVGEGIDPTKKTIEVHTETLDFTQSWNTSLGLSDADDNATIIPPDINEN